MRIWLPLIFLAGMALAVQASVSSSDHGAAVRQAAPRTDRPCTAADSSDHTYTPSADLYCIELFPAAGIEGVRGVVEMAPPSSPFGVAVTHDGIQEYDLSLTIEGLSDAATLGPYKTYVAWATTPQLHPFVKLGVVRDGRLTGARVAFDQFLVIVSAEASADVAEREGRLVLRGLSPSTRLQPHDLPFLLAGMLDGGDSAGATASREHDEGHAARPTPDPSWTPPPMHPQVSMPAPMMTLRPGASPYRVSDAGDAPVARHRETVRLADGDTFDLVAAPVRRDRKSVV